MKDVTRKDKLINNIENEKFTTTDGFIGKIISIECKALLTRVDIKPNKDWNGVYLMTFSDGKFYIGKTKNSIFKRISEHIFDKSYEFTYKKPSIKQKYIQSFINSKYIFLTVTKIDDNTKNEMKHIKEIGLKNIDNCLNTSGIRLNKYQEGKGKKVKKRNEYLDSIKSHNL